MGGTPLRLPIELRSMFVSKSLDYAFRALTYLSTLDAEAKSVGMREIADAMEIPSHYLSKILRLLVKAELVQSDMGPGGGYSLRRGASQITVADIYRAVEGSFQVVACTDGEHECVHSENCSHIPIWTRIERDILTLLEKTSLAEFIPPAAPAVPHSFVALSDLLRTAQ